MRLDAEKRFLAAFLALVMVFSLFPWTSFEVFAVSDITVLGGKIKISGDTNNTQELTVSNGVVTAKSKIKESQDCTTSGYVTTYSGLKATITITNNTTSKATITFTYTAGANVSSVTDSTGSSGSVSVVLDAGSTVKVYIQGNGTSKTAYGVATLQDFTYTEKSEKTLTYGEAVNGSYTVKGVTPVAGESIQVDTTELVKLVATPANDNYVFAGWKDAISGKYLHSEKECEILVTENITLVPVFAEKSNINFIVYYQDKQQTRLENTIGLVG